MVVNIVQLKYCYVCLNFCLKVSSDELDCLKDKILYLPMSKDKFSFLFTLLNLIIVFALKTLARYLWPRVIHDTVMKVHRSKDTVMKVHRSKDQNRCYKFFS